MFSPGLASCPAGREDPISDRCCEVVCRVLGDAGTFVTTKDGRRDTGEGMQDYVRVTVMMPAIRWHTWMGSLSLLQCYDGRSIFEPSSGNAGQHNYMRCAPRQTSTVLYCRISLFL